MKQGIYLLPLIFSVLGFQKVTLNNSNTRVIQNQTQGPIIHQLEYGKENIILNQTMISSIIGIELKQSDDKPNNNICTPILNDLVFPDFDSLIQTKIIDNINENDIEIPDDYVDPSYFLSYPMLVNMVQLTNAIAAVTTDHYLVIIDAQPNNTIQSGFQLKPIARISFAFLRKSQNQFQTPQILYDPISDTLFMIYQDQIIRFSVQKMDQQKAELKNDYVVGNQIMEDEFIGTVKISNGHLFIPVGYKGLLIYEILQTGEINLIKSFTAIDLYEDQSKKIYIIDVEIGGDNGEFIYILDRINGIVLLNINDLKNIKNYNPIGKIDIYGGTVIKQWKNSLFVLLEGYIYLIISQQYLSDINSQVKEIGIKIDKNEWYILKTHYLFGHYFDIEVTEKFAILLGLDMHLIIYHSIWQGFQNVEEQQDAKIKQVSKLKEEYLFMPGIQQLLFYTQKEYSNNQGYQEGHSFLIGLTKSGIIDIPYQSSWSYVKCFTDDRYYIGKTLDYELKINTTDCQIQIKESYYEQSCIYTQKIQLRMVANDVMYFTIEELFSIIIGLVILLFSFSAMIAYCLGNLFKKKQILEQEIIGFENKGLSVDISFYPQDQL